MTRRRRNILVIGAMSIIVFVLFFAQMQMVGLEFANSLLYALVMGGMTAAVGAMSFGYREFLQRRAFSGKKLASDTLDSHQERTVEIDLPLEAAFDLSLEALWTLDGQDVPIPDDILVKMESIMPRKQVLKMQKQDRNMGSIRADLRAKTMGITEPIHFANIDVQLQRIDDKTTRIHIESKSNLLVDSYDLGKNLHYVNELALYLRRESQQMDAEVRLKDSESHRFDEQPLSGETSQESESDGN